MAKLSGPVYTVPMNIDAATLEVVRDIRGVDSGEWDRLAADDHVSPFLEHAFLASLESSGCVSSEAGWYPQHLLFRENGRLRAAAPLYAKTHSMGEFVFDQGLAKAAGMLGKPYYPKLVATVPFTPSPGYRFLTESGADESALIDVMLMGIRELRDRGKFAGMSILFTDPAWAARELDHRDDLARWVHQCFLWNNPGLRDFNDYLDGFRKSQRHNIRRERTAVRKAGLEIRVIPGVQADEKLMDRMYEFYESTNERFGPWAAFFLNREWFHTIAQSWGRRLLFIGAWRSNSEDPVALSLFVLKGGRLIGRYWGCLEFVKHLHFELCYYAPVEYVIDHGFESFDPGMGSLHKARRGFGSREFGSYHALSDGDLDGLFRTILSEANREERRMIDALNAEIPIKDPNENLTEV